MTAKQLVTVSSVTIIAAGLLGLLIALTSKSLVYLVVSWAWTGVGCTLSPAIIHAILELASSQRFLPGLSVRLSGSRRRFEAIISSRFTTFFIAAFFRIIFSLLFPVKESASIEKIRKRMIYQQKVLDNKQSSA